VPKLLKTQSLIFYLLTVLVAPSSGRSHTKTHQFSLHAARVIGYYYIC